MSRQEFALRVRDRYRKSLAMKMDITGSMDLSDPDTFAAEVSWAISIALQEAGLLPDSLARRSTANGNQRP